MKLTLNYLQQKKQAREKISVLTAYDFPTAKLIDEANIDMILVGDSLANVVLGLASTADVGMDEMLHHTRAVVRAVKRALIIGDMPFTAYQTDGSDPVREAKRFIDAGCDIVKLEWFHKCFDVAHAMVQAGIPTMGHVGLTPQTAKEFKVQGKDQARAKEILEQAKTLDAAGCCAIVLECIPKNLAQEITRNVNAVTIGIGAGVECDGQVLVTHDLLGLIDGFKPKFAKRYTSLSEHMRTAFKAYHHDVSSAVFPDDEHTFH